MYPYPQANSTSLTCLRLTHFNASTYRYQSIISVYINKYEVIWTFNKGKLKEIYMHADMSKSQSRRQIRENNQLNHRCVQMSF